MRRFYYARNNCLTASQQQISLVIPQLTLQVSLSIFKNGKVNSSYTIFYLRNYVNLYSLYITFFPCFPYGLNYLFILTEEA